MSSSAEVPEYPNAAHEKAKAALERAPGKMGPLTDLRHELTSIAWSLVALTEEVRALRDQQ